MSVFTVIGHVLTKAAGIVSVVVGIAKQMLPFIKAAREVVPAIDGVLDKAEAALAAGGAEADDFFDRNMPALRDLLEVSIDLQNFAAALEAVVDEAIKASQVDTPDEITVAEAKAIAIKIDALRTAGVKLASMDGLEAKLAAMG